MSDTLSDDEIKALLKKYQACSERGHPTPDCICNGIAMANWKELARELLAARETIARLREQVESGEPENPT